MNVNPTTTTVREVVVENYRTAAVFQKYDLDFCCGGGATIERACEKKGVDIALLLADLENMKMRSDADEVRVKDWELDFLADHIEQNHHRYVRTVVPSILEHAEKVARVHGPVRPELVRVATLFAHLANDLESHMTREEQVLFPYIKALVHARRENSNVPVPHFGAVSNPIRMMEAEHERAGDEMKEIRELTANYVPPPDACMTYRVLFKELEDFENDLYRHVHLENNVLFPKVISLESGTVSGTLCCIG